jgi:chromosome segregation ATPase
VADDEETAKKVAFNDFRKFNCVTIKGDKYQPSGILSGGFNDSSRILFKVQEYKDHEDKRKLIEKELYRLDANIEGLRQASK